MKTLDDDIGKPQDVFSELYGKHDNVEGLGERGLERVGVEIEQEGIDRRDEDVWEGGDDQPDIFASAKRQAYIDWKAKSSIDFIGWINKRAYESYIDYSDLPVFAGFALEDDLSLNNYCFCNIKLADCEDMGKQWDENEVYNLTGTAFLSFYQFVDFLVYGRSIWYRTIDSVFQKPLRKKPKKATSISTWAKTE